MQHEYISVSTFQPSSVQLSIF